MTVRSAIIKARPVGARLQPGGPTPEGLRLGILKCGLIALTIALAGCAKTPVSPTGSVSVAAAAPLAPANGAAIAYAAQPITLTVMNATTTDPNVAVGYTFEVATDTNFDNRVATKTVAQAAAQTALTLDPLPGGTKYYWHVRATAGDTPGEYTLPFTFTVGPAIAITAPVVVAPMPGASVPTDRPTLTVTNATHTGPIGMLLYRFEIATNAAFTNIVLTGTVREGATQTSFTPLTPLGFSTTYFWRVRATDADSDVSGSYSTASTFITPSNPDQAE
jgi:hypothetical protein